MANKNSLVKENSQVKCQWCSGITDAKSWNAETFKQCSSREMKRAFKDIYNIQVWLKNSDNYYKCPKCGTWSRGNQLILLDNKGNIVRSVGNVPIMIIKPKS